MYLVFLSQSGLAGSGATDPSQPHLVHAGILVHEGQYITMAGEYDALIRRHFGSPPGDPAVPAPMRPADLYQGAGPFRSWSPQRRAELIQDCLGILIRRETPLLVSYIDRARYQAARAADHPAFSADTDPSQLAFSRLLLALAMFLDENVMSQMNPDDIMQSVWQVSDYAMLLADAPSPPIARALSEFLGEESETVSPNIYDDLLVAPPATCVGARLAALCAYIVRRWLQQPNAAHGYFDALRDGRVLQVIYPYQFD